MISQFFFGALESLYPRNRTYDVTHEILINSLPLNCQNSNEIWITEIPLIVKVYTHKLSELAHSRKFILALRNCFAKVYPCESSTRESFNI